MPSGTFPRLVPEVADAQQGRRLLMLTIVIPNPRRGHNSTPHRFPDNLCVCPYACAFMHLVAVCINKTCLYDTGLGYTSLSLLALTPQQFVMQVMPRRWDGIKSAECSRAKFSDENRTLGITLQITFLKFVLDFLSQVTQFHCLVGDTDSLRFCKLSASIIILL